MAEISRRFGDKAELVNTHTGLSFQLLPYTDRSETEIEQNAASLGLSVRGIGSYRLSDSKSVWRPCLVIGYGSLEDKKIPQAVDLLYKAIFE
ncbi:MAG: hypothetical protein IIY11_02290 [Clostridia bacterium]|nr:hypothetical protein [Clostridia bacterium]